MIIFLDIDGVLLNLDKAFQVFTNKYLNEDGKGAFVNKLSSSEWGEIWEYFLEDAVSANLELLISKESYSILSSKNEIYLVTGFPSLYKDKRLDNLRRVGLDFDEIYFLDKSSTGRKVDIIKEIVKGDDFFIFVDDVVINCQEVYECFPRAFVLTAHNSYIKQNGAKDIYSVDCIFGQLIPAYIDKIEGECMKARFRN